MGKRTFSIVLALALFAGVFSIVPALAQSAQPTEVPPVVQIEDPYGDANTMSGDQQLGADGGSQTDIGKVWFTHDASSVSVHFLTEGAPTANSLGFQFVVAAGEAGCLLFEGYYDGATYTSESFARVRDNCNTIDPVPGTLVFAAGPGGEGGLATINVPREGVPSLADGSVISKPIATTWIFAGGEQITPTGYRGVRQRIDDTKVGADYTIASGGPVVAPAPEKPKEEPPGKSDPPGKGKKKGCGKGKGKQKGACPGKPKPPQAPSCPAFTPGEEGAEAETTVVTDAATEEKPVVVELTAGVGLANDLGIPGIAGQPSVYDETSSVFQNIQVDTANADAGLYARLDFPAFHDYDLYLNYPDGSTAANSGDFNVAPGEGLGGGSPDGAWEAGNDFEQVMGIRTADCGGFTARMVSYLTNGGAITLSVWLGDVVADPVAPEGSGEALSTFYSLLGI